MNKKRVLQLDENRFLVGFTEADESPLEPGIFLFPANTLDLNPPTIPEGKRAKWVNEQWVFEDLPLPELKPYEIPTKKRGPEEMDWYELRHISYPPITEFIDGYVKGDQAQIDRYVAECLAVKAKYPKPE
jgi:hypothetical protein